MERKKSSDEGDWLEDSVNRNGKRSHIHGYIYTLVPNRLNGRRLNSGGSLCPGA